MKLNKIAAAIITCSIGLSFGASASTDFFGYARAGMHFSPNSQSGDGYPDYIKAEGAGGKYRLGNEDDWAELGVRHDLYEEDDQRAEIGFMMGTWHNQRTGSNSFTIMQAWGQLYGVFGSDKTSLWGGQRYTRNIDDDMLDFKFWDNSGRGAGIRDIELNNSLVDMSMVYHNYEFDLSSGSGTGRTGIFSPEARIHSIDVLGGNLTLGVNYAGVVDDTEIVKETGKDIEKHGYMLTLNHKGSIGPTYNIFTVQVNGGIAVSGYTSEAKFNVEAPGTSFRIMNSGWCTISDNWSCAYSLAYENNSMDDDRQDSKEWFAVGIRPKYDWNNFTQTEFEFGYQEATSKKLDRTNSSFKATISQRFHLGAVPSIRFYATHATEDRTWKEQRFGSHVADTRDIDSLTLGVQFDAWW